MVFIGGFMAGLMIYALLFPGLENWANATSLGELTLPQVFGVPYGALVLGTLSGAMLLVALRAARRGARVAPRDDARVPHFVARVLGQSVGQTLGEHMGFWIPLLPQRIVLQAQGAGEIDDTRARGGAFGYDAPAGWYRSADSSYCLSSSSSGVVDEPCRPILCSSFPLVTPPKARSTRNG